MEDGGEHHNFEVACSIVITHLVMPYISQVMTIIILLRIRLA